jgi:hypothetical protein
VLDAVLIPHSGDMPTSSSEDPQCMAAAADRPSGDVFERVSPELVLVDAALFEEMRRRLAVSDDTLARIGSARIDPHVAIHVAEVELDEERDAENNAFAGGEPLPVLATALDVAHHDAGIEDLLVIPEDDLASMPPTLLVVPGEGGTRLVPEHDEVVAFHVSEIDHLVAVSAEDRAEPQRTSRSYPALPSPPSDADEEDATEVVLRQIRDHIELEAPPAPRRLRLLSFVSLVAALSSIAIFTAYLQLGVSELPHWLPS